jgi:para-aminobenzoate synthetase component I
MLKINKEISTVSKEWDMDFLFSITDKYSGMCLFTSSDDFAAGKNIIGINPVLNITRPEEIDDLLSLNKDDSDTPLAMGYIAYDYKDKLEEHGLFSDLHENLFPEFYFSVFEYYIIAENSDKKNLKIIRLDMPIKYQKISETEILQTLVPPVKDGTTEYLGSTLNKTEYEEGVVKIKEYIRSGDIYQANLTRKISGKTSLSPFNIALRLKNSNPVEFGVFAKIEDKYVISTSPERFFRVENSVLTAEPVKGTIRRSENEATDKINLSNLIKNKKELAELSMIVDLLRNDMNKICSDVAVKGFPLVMKLKNVYQLYSVIEGKLGNCSFTEIIKALFPGGSITGCPKIRACQIIEELERSGRGLYTGNFGYINFNGNMDFNIMIRTLFYDNGFVSFNTGGGITLLSDPVQEYEETIHKAKNIYDAIVMEEVWEERYCLTVR